MPDVCFYYIYWQCAWSWLSPYEAFSDTILLIFNSKGNFSVFNNPHVFEPDIHSSTLLSCILHFRVYGLTLLIKLVTLDVSINLN